MVKNKWMRTEMRAANATIAIMAGLLLVVSAAALTLTGCSAAQFDTGFKNLTAAQCANQQATLQNLPLGFLTPAQAQQVLGAVCSALYGTTAAPVSATGMSPVLK